MKTRIAYRTKQIIITLSKPGGHRWVEWTIQRLEKKNDTDGIISLDDSFDKYNKRIDLTATQMHKAKDPVTGKKLNVSTAGIEMLIKAAIIRWTKEEGKLKFDKDKDELVDN